MAPPEFRGAERAPGIHLLTTGPLGLWSREHGSSPEGPPSSAGATQPQGRVQAEGQEAWPGAPTSPQLQPQHLCFCEWGRVGGAGGMGEGEGGESCFPSQTVESLHGKWGRGLYSAKRCKNRWDQVSVSPRESPFWTLGLDPRAALQVSPGHSCEETALGHTHRVRPWGGVVQGCRDSHGPPGTAGLHDHQRHRSGF